MAKNFMYFKICGKIIVLFVEISMSFTFNICNGVNNDIKRVTVFDGIGKTNIMFECSLMTHQPASKTLIESIVPDSLFLFLLIVLKKLPLTLNVIEYFLP